MKLRAVLPLLAVVGALIACGRADPFAGRPAQSPANTPGPTAAAGTPAAPSPRVLLDAAGAGNGAPVQAQLAARVTPDARDAEGRTALYLAAAGGHIEVARALLAAGADVNAADRAGNTPYYVAALARHAELAGILLDAGADRVGTRAYGGTPLIAIAERGWVDVAREILKRPNIPVDHVNNLGWTALIEAIILGRGGPDHQEIVRMLLTAGENPNLPDGTGKSPRTLAVERRYLEIVRLIEASGGR